ncbi:ribosomal protein S18 acetylase RimI-like enzyme [Agromyces hippuratus]|uniref:Ribosomal protein S18 acetylase RimI-like enzyme n=1 Tax=Agromyces hippuratus TaxID=286438 RepID=A0A852X2R8_9MICO|nr:GNAT family acetyltransferase [Agromyces hippuratus]NYG20401.1 ribosomal protein S18 acetylase RimI-like enzyme [Agromyces hippuratus]
MTGAADGGQSRGAAVRIRPFDVADTEPVVALWHSAGLVVPWNDPYRDIERKLAVQPELFLVGEFNGTVVATAMVGYDGHRGWVNYLAVDLDRRGERLGALLMAEAERLLAERGCPKLNLQVRSTNAGVIAFYRGLGYQVDDVTSLGKRLIPDVPANAVHPDSVRRGRG